MRSQPLRSARSAVRIALFFFACATASAAPVTYLFSGTIFENASNAFSGPGFPGIAQDDPFTGKIVFDDAAVDTEPLATVGRFYLSAAPATLIQMTVNGLTFTLSTSASPIITTNNDIFGRDSFALVGHGLFNMPPGWSASGSPLTYSSSFAVADYSQTAFTSDAIPPLLKLTDFQQQNEYASVRFTIQTSTSGTVTLNHPGGANAYINSVDLMGDIHSLYLEGAVLPGDFNQSGTVDAADYVVWRNSIDTPTDYELWRSNFGRSAGGGAVSPLSVVGSANVPEPGSGLLSIVAAVLAASAIMASSRAAEEIK